MMNLEIKWLDENNIACLKGKPCVVYAAGKNGREIMQYLCDNGIENASFYDDDMSIWGGS